MAVGVRQVSATCPWRLRVKVSRGMDGDPYLMFGWDGALFSDCGGEDT